MIRKLGMFSPEIQRDTIERFFDAVHLYGFEEMQFDFLTVGPEEIPDSIDATLVRRIRRAADAHGVTIRAVNGTFNMIHPDPAVVERGIAAFEGIARACAELGCGIITLCTGSRNTQSMWRPHPDNGSEEAWRDLLATAKRLDVIAKKYDVLLGIETEASNVVNTPERALKLLEDMGSDQFGIILDPANLFHCGDALPERSEAILEHAFALLRERIILAHAKDIHAGNGIEFTSAGRGIVAFERFFALLDSIGYDGPIIAHGIHDEAEFPYSVQFLNSKMRGL